MTSKDGVTQEDLVYPTTPSAGGSDVKVEGSTATAPQGFRADQAYWWNSIGAVAMRALEQAGYPESAKQSHQQLLLRHVIPALGTAPLEPPSPGAAREPVFSSFMCDDFSPVEFGITWAKGKPAVRFSIEAIDTPSELSSSGGLNSRATFRLCDALGAQGIGHFETFCKVADCMMSKEPAPEAKTNSQLFVAFDLATDGDTMVKGYLVPEVKARRTGMKNLDVIDAALREVGAAFSAWHCVKTYVTGEPSKDDPGLNPEECPEAVILSTDCVNDDSARFKIYFRYPTTDFRHILRHLSLGGRIFSGWKAPLASVWQALLGTDPLSGATSATSNLNELTGGVLLYYDFTRTSELPTAKAYLPVRHFAKSDLDVANELAGLVSSWTGDEKQGLKVPYPQALRYIFPERTLEGRKMHNYVCLGQKKDGRLDISTYLNPQLFTALQNSASPEIASPSPTPAPASKKQQKEAPEIAIADTCSRVQKTAERSPRRNCPS